VRTFLTGIEIATMKKKATNVESEWQHRCESEGYVDPPERLAVIEERIAEAKSMLAALNTRFPSPLSSSRWVPFVEFDQHKRLASGFA
jgi:hypothetical protein